MTFTYNEEEYTLPASLSDIPLHTHVSWIVDYGAELTSKKIAAGLEPNEESRELQLHLIFVDEATKAFSHYTGIPLDEVQSNFELGQILNAYTVTQILLAVEARGVEVQPSYEWHAATWVIAPVDLGSPTSMTIDQFRTVKKLAEYVLALSEGDWTKMGYICAAYFRLEGEEFNPDFIVDGNDRLNMMTDLPMDYALAVATYLQSSLSVFTSLIATHIAEQAPEILDQPALPAEPLEAPVVIEE